MPLSAFDLFAPVVSALFSTYAGRIDWLAIYDARGGLWVSLEANPQSLAQGLVHPFLGSIHSPKAEVVVDGLPRWEVVW
jgi:hypothetical protein